MSTTSKDPQLVVYHRSGVTPTWSGGSSFVTTPTRSQFHRKMKKTRKKRKKRKTNKEREREE
jgi:hypothetical protein